MATTYGDFPGVKVTTSGGGITGVDVGSEEVLVLFGKSDQDEASVSVNTPEQIGARREADVKFGEDSELADGMKEALSNGANISYLWGVAVEDTSVTGEAHAGTQDGTLDNAPVTEDTSTVTVTDTSDDEELTVEFRYGTVDDSNAPSDSDTIWINPFTGDFAADESSDYEFDYSYEDWSSAFDAADSTVEEDDTAIYAALSEAESVASTLSGKVTTLREDYKMVKGIAGAEPNDSDEEGYAEFDTADYSDEIDSSSQFLLAPVRLEESERTVLGGAAGVFAGNPIDDPIYNDVIRGYTDLQQKITKSEEDDLRGEEVIPVRQAGSIRMKDNLSTSTETDWERDFWRVRIVDRVILVGKQVGDDTIGRVNTEETRKAARRVIRTQIEKMVNDGLLKPNTDEEERWYVDVYESTTDTDQVNVDIGITPYGVVKRVDETVTINT